MCGVNLCGVWLGRLDWRSPRVLLNRYRLIRALKSPHHWAESGTDSNDLQLLFFVFSIACVRTVGTHGYSLFQLAGFRRLEGPALPQ